MNNTMLERLLKDLNSRKAAVREAALRESHALPPEQLQQLFERQAEICRLGRRRILSLSSTILLIWSVGFFLMTILSGLLRLPHLMILYLLSAGGGTIYYIVQSLSVRFSPLRAVRELLTLIEGKEDVGFLAPLLEFRYGERQTISPTLRNVILRLLPQLRAEQVNTWTAEQKQFLLLPLAYPLADEKVTVSILKALEQVGDAEALPIVKQLAANAAMGLYDEPLAVLRVQQAARDCLPYLEARAEQSGEAQILLRASDAAADAGPDVLLRPAAQNTDTVVSEQLLRPTTTQE